MVERAWSGLHRTLVPTLARRVGRAAAEDVVQDLVVQALTRPEPFASAAAVRRWVSNCAWQQVLRLERSVRCAPAELPPDGVVDVEANVIRRLDLEQLAAAVGRLAPADRRALTDVASALSPAEHARRHRVRAKLKQTIGTLPAVLGWRWQNWLRRHQLWLAEAIPMAAASAGLSVAILVGPGLEPAPHHSRMSIASSGSATRAPRLPGDATSSAVRAAPDGTRSAHPSGRGDLASTTQTHASRQVVLAVDPGTGTRANVTDGDDDPPLACIGPTPADSTCVPDPISPVVASVLSGLPQP